ncbi:uncharacterized protein LOC143983061 isoform X4 [Lithobates pipiens]
MYCSCEGEKRIQACALVWDWDTGRYCSCGGEKGSQACALVGWNTGVYCSRRGHGICSASGDTRPKLTFNLHWSRHLLTAGKSSQMEHCQDMRCILAHYAFSLSGVKKVCLA